MSDFAKNIIKQIHNDEYVGEDMSDTAEIKLQSKNVVGKAISLGAIEPVGYELPNNLFENDVCESSGS